MTTIESSLRDFLMRQVGDVEFDRDDDLFAVGLVNSLLALQLLLFIEKEFSIVVGDQDLTRENFRSIVAIESFVLRKRLQGSSLGS